MLYLGVFWFEQKKTLLQVASNLHCNISDSFCSFSYSGVCFVQLKLSIDDIIIIQKGSNGDLKFKLYDMDYYFTCTLCAKLHLWAKILNLRKYTPLYEKLYNQTKIALMETTLQLFYPEALYTEGRV